VERGSRRHRLGRLGWNGKLAGERPWKAPGL